MSRLNKYRHERNRPSTRWLRAFVAASAGNWFRSKPGWSRHPLFKVTRLAIALLFAQILATRIGAEVLPAWDFREPSWTALHDCRLGSPDPNDGLPVLLSGPDPYFGGPDGDFPTNQALWLELELNSDQGGTAQIFFFGTGSGPTEERSVRFAVPAGRWHTARLPLPTLGPATRFRLDPPGSRGICRFRQLRFAPRLRLDPPNWPRPEFPLLGADAPHLRSGDLGLVHGSHFGEFQLRVANETFAIGQNQPRLGYLLGGNVRWLGLTGTATVVHSGESLRVTTRAADADGAVWEILQSFQPSARPGGFEVENRITVSQDRSVVFLPVLTLFAGVGTFGTNKTQGLVAGVEYLENEESSSERDLIGPQSRRQVPDSLKMTFPLMSLSTDRSWAGLMWEPSSRVSALFDSPDRLFNSGGSVLALLFPGSDPSSREEGQLLPYDGEVLKADEPLVVRATLLGGVGNTVVPSVQEYVARRGLPPLPSPVMSAREYYELAAHGWLDSDIRDGDRFRHAVGPTFGSQPAVDAAFYMDCIAGLLGTGELTLRLRSQAASSLALVPPANRVGAQVGHVRYPVAPLVYGGVAENAATALADGQRLLERLQPDGSLPYVAPAAGPDYGSTHWSREANGLAAAAVLSVLERGVFSGDPGLIREGLRLVRALDRFRDGVPRGAQTWEIPLHTPDILASAHLVRAYTLGYELTGEPGFLDQARYWAWTGVPFIYLAAPGDRPVGVYSTTPVLGATQWIAPNWIGLPVQWCGLVYADALRRFARHDGSGPWIRLADGIALAGVQHTHTAAEPDKQGLLPDSFDLRAQLRNPVPINPATLLPLALQAYGAPPVYDFRCFRQHGLLVHAPGPLLSTKERNDAVSFRVEGWPRNPWFVLINGLSRTPRVKLDGQEINLDTPHHFDPAAGRLVLQLKEPTDVELLFANPPN